MRLLACFNRGPSPKPYQTISTVYFILDILRTDLWSQGTAPEDFRWKFSPARISSQLVNPALLSGLLLCVIGMRNCSWLTARNWVNIRRISSSSIKHDSTPCCLETQNARSRHTLDDVRADTKRTVQIHRKMRRSRLQLANTKDHARYTSFARDEIINSLRENDYFLCCKEIVCD